MEIFYNLRQFVKGKITNYELRDSDRLIREVRYNNQNIAQSVVYIEYPTEESFLKSLSLSEEDVYFVLGVTSSYNNYELYDLYSVEEDFLEGYGIWNYFDSDNYKLIGDISRSLFNLKYDFIKDEEKRDFAKRINNIYPKLMDGIYQDFANEKNNEFQTTASNIVSDDIEGFLSDYDLELVRWDGFKTTVANLISLYIQYNSAESDLKSLFKQIFSNNEKSGDLGGWDDARYEMFDDSNFDNDSFNREVNRVFEKIHEEIMEDNEKYSDFVREISKIIDRFDLNKWYDIPQDKNYQFKITDFQKPENLILGKLYKKPRGPERKFSMSVDNFNKLLYHPRLFDLFN